MHQPAIVHVNSTSIKYQRVNGTKLFGDHHSCPEGKIHGANMGHLGAIWSRQDPRGPHLGPMNFAIWVTRHSFTSAKLWWSSKLFGTDHSLGLNIRQQNHF